MMFRLAILSFVIWVLSLSAAHADNRYASIIVDADTLEVLHARQIDQTRYPASLTKVMTLYLTFDALNANYITLDQKLPVSKTAAQTPPSKMGLRAGQSISVDTLIQAVAVRSANDAAVVLAEHIGGSEAAFAEMMTAKARQLGMSRTEFKTANGLPDPDQKTTARDMAKLAYAMLTHHANYYHYFGQKEFRGKRNTNKLLISRSDVDGFKTGYTRASGYNLMVSAVKDGRRQITIVLGGASNDSRNQHVSDLIDRGFSVMAQTPIPMQTAQRQQSASAPSPVIVNLRGTDSRLKHVQTAGHNLPQVSIVKDWAVQVNGYHSPEEANHVAKQLAMISGGGTTEPRSGFSQGKAVYHARLTGLSAKSAQKACKSLALTDRRCLIIAP